MKESKTCGSGIRTSRAQRTMSVWVASVPPLLLLTATAVMIILNDPAAIGDYSPWILLGSAGVGAILAALCGYMRRRAMMAGLMRAARQLLPAIPMLLLIAVLATSWMIGGIVPSMVNFGMGLLDPRFFLCICCVVCALVSVMTGSSWSTIATIGVAFIGIGEAMGHSAAWTAGAVISGAYFGDKVSPLSDTTVIASATCQVEIFTHIRYMMATTLPALAIALIVFTLKGCLGDVTASAGASELTASINSVFHTSPWLLLIPLGTFVMIAFRVPTLITLGTSSLAGVICAVTMQRDLLASDGNLLHSLLNSFRCILAGFSAETGNESVDSLISTGGVLGILPVVFLVLSALIFGWIMIGSGMLNCLTDTLTRRLRRRFSIVSASIASGVTLGAFTADQYLSIIIGGNMYRSLYRRHQLEPRLLSRSLEDSVSATSPLIPWSSCGVTQATVLGVSTLAYFPFCIFNYLTPLFGIALAATGWGIPKKKTIR